jgi:hypothetical protein
VDCLPWPGRPERTRAQRAGQAHQEDLRDDDDKKGALNRNPDSVSLASAYLAGSDYGPAMEQRQALRSPLAATQVPWGVTAWDLSCI